MDKTQCDLILEALRDGPKSQQELRDFTRNKVQNITARISDLRDKGYTIETEDFTSSEGALFVRFKLQEAQGVLL